MSDGQKIHIEKWNSDVDGELNAENMEKKLHLQGYNFTQYCFAPGTNFPDHTHEVSKKDAIISGQFQFGMYGQTVILEPGDIVEVPRRTVHNACVVGKQSVTFYDSTKS